MEETLTYSGSLTVVTCWCGMRHAVPSELRNHQLAQHNEGSTNVTGIYCPLGHSHVPKGETELTKMRKKLDAEFELRMRMESAHDQTRAELRETESRRRGEKAAKTRIKNRIQHGVCPCCNRSFANLAAHMKGKHPEYAKTDA